MAIAYFLVPNALFLFVASLILFYVILKRLNKKFGFVNGDCLGHTLEHTELLLLNIALVIMA